MRKARIGSVFVVGLVVSVVLLASADGSGAAQGAKRYFVFESKALTIRMAVLPHRVRRLSVDARGVCEDGSRVEDLGFGVVGGAGLPIRGKKRRFNRTISGGTYGTLVFKGAVHDDVVRGVFRERVRARELQPSGDEGPGQQCGTGSPRGEWFHFVAHEVGEKAVPPWMR